MQEEENKNLENEQEKTLEKNYIDEIQKLKANSVPKEKYDEVLENNKKLIETLAENRKVEEPKKTEEKVDINKFREELYNSDKELSNLDYVDKTLKLRKAIIDSGEMDPFVPNGKKIVPTEDDIRKAEKVATALQHCVDYARENGNDNEVFTNELQRITVDIPLPKRMNRLY